VEGVMMPLPNDKQQYTYADYCTWPDSERWELIEGVPYAMSLVPNQQHQKISVELTVQFGVFLKGKSCELFTAPFDVRLNVNEDDDTVCQPDLLVVCDHSKLDGKCCNGAPDLVIEISSPSTARHDRVIKLRLYQKAGVREYWIVDPETKTVQVCTLQNGQYIIRGYTDEDTPEVEILTGCEVNLKDVFGE